MGSESDCLLGALRRIFEISDSEAGMKVEKLRGVADGAGESGNNKVERAERNRRSLVTLLVTKKQSCQRVR